MFFEHRLHIYSNCGLKTRRRRAGDEGDANDRWQRCAVPTRHVSTTAGRNHAPTPCIIIRHITPAVKTPNVIPATNPATLAAGLSLEEEIEHGGSFPECFAQESRPRHHLHAQQ